MEVAPLPGPTMLDVSNLMCVRGERQLFAGVGFRLRAGELLYLRGANGAGKTSLLRILCGLSPPEAGLILWDGVSTKELREAYRCELLYLGHHNALQEALSVEENLRFDAALAGATPSANDVSAALARLGVRSCQSRLVRHLSQGQKRCVALSRLALSRARLWLLDEPFVALDQRAIGNLLELLLAHLDQGGLVVFTSHQAVDLGAVRPQVLELAA